MKTCPFKVAIRFVGHPTDRVLARFFRPGDAHAYAKNVRDRYTKADRLEEVLVSKNKRVLGAYRPKEACHG